MADRSSTSPDVHDAGDKIILSCEDEATLRHVVEEMEREGAREIQMPGQGREIKWIASFEHPRPRDVQHRRIAFEIIITARAKARCSRARTNSASAGAGRARPGEGGGE